MSELKPEDIQCPVCGYYCLGKGGHGCIDKPFLVYGTRQLAKPVSEDELAHIARIESGFDFGVEDCKRIAKAILDKCNVTEKEG